MNFNFNLGDKFYTIEDGQSTVKEIYKIEITEHGICYYECGSNKPNYENNMFKTKKDLESKIIQNKTKEMNEMITRSKCLEDI